jgi:3-oxoadipate enol-lactonase
VPALVIVGACDRLTPPAAARRLAERLAGARLVCVPRAGHNVMLEQPRRVNQAIAEFRDDSA